MGELISAVLVQNPDFQRRINRSDVPSTLLDGIQYIHAWRFLGMGSMAWFLLARSQPRRPGGAPWGNEETPGKWIRRGNAQAHIWHAGLKGRIVPQDSKISLGTPDHVHIARFTFQVS